VKGEIEMVNGLTAQMQQDLAVLMEQLKQGEITKEDLSDRMEQEIYKELAKPAEEINNAWIDACADLMTYADKEQLAAWPDEHEKLDQTIRSILTKPRRWHLPSFQLPGRWALPIFCTLGIAVFTCLLLVGGVLRWSLLYPEQSADGQEYYIRGKQFKVMEGGEARADDPNIEIEECVTQDFNELCEFLGFMPAMPTWVPDGWELTEYYGCFNGRDYDYEVLYEKPGVKYVLRYSFSYKATPEHSAVTFFQDGVGHNRKLANRKEVYILTNSGDVVAVWHTNNTIEELGGPISEDEVIKMVESIQIKEEK